MTKEQRDTIQKILAGRGLTFAPLQEEMIDHIGCDVELLMNSGKSFEEALQLTLNKIPDDHFSTIQRNVLVGIDKRSLAVQRLSNLALATLLLAFLFKVLHLQFFDVILFTSFLLIGATLLRGAYLGSLVVGKQKGITLVLFTLSGLVILLAGYALRLFHLPGADIAIIAGVLVNIAALLSNTAAAYHHPLGKETMLTFLHEKYESGIERFLLILLLFTTAVKILGVVTSFQTPFTIIILLIVIYGAGLHFIAMIWGRVQSQAQNKRPIFLAGLMTASICLPLPFLGEILPFEIRIVSIVAFMLASGFLAHRMKQATNPLSTIAATFVPLLFLLWAMLRLGVLPADFHHYIFNLPVLVLMVVMLLLSKKHDTMRAFMIVSLAGYLVEYSLLK